MLRLDELKHLKKAPDGVCEESKAKELDVLRHQKQSWG